MIKDHITGISFCREIYNGDMRTLWQVVWYMTRARCDWTKVVEIVDNRTFQRMRISTDSVINSMDSIMYKI